jgi:hypothetical protein
MDQKLMDMRESVAGFRRRLIEDSQFRREFAADPDGTLREIGIDVPAGSRIAPLEAEALENRISRLREALGDDIAALYSADEYDKLARDPQKMLRLQEVMSVARNQPSELAEVELEAVAAGQREGVNKGDVVAYTISAYSTLDW